MRYFFTLLLLPVVFWSFFLSGTAFSTDYYVDNSGSPACSNDSSRGTEENPWCSIPYGVSQLLPGDTLYVKSGTYTDYLAINNLSGSDNNRITIQAYPGDTVILLGQGLNSGRIRLINCHYLTFKGFQITNFNQGLFVDQESSHIILDELTVHYVGQEGIHVKENSHYITIQNCTVYDTRKWQYNGEGVYIGTGSAGPLDNTNNVIVRDCTIYNTIDEAIEIKPGTHDCLVENNIIYNITTGQSYGAIEVNENSAGVQNWGSNPNHVIRNNIIHDTDTAIRAGTGCLVYNNIIYDVGTEDRGIYVNNWANDNYTRKIYHNTIDMPSSSAIVVASGSTDIKNNIGPATVNNIASNASYYVNSQDGNEDYHLILGSAPIDAGVDLTGVVAYDFDGIVRTSGSSPDLGAFEYSDKGVTPPKPPQNLRIIN